MNQTVNRFSSPFFTCFSRTFLSSSFPLFFVVFFFPSDSQTISNGHRTSDCSISPALLRNLFIQGISRNKLRAFSLCLLKVPDAGKMHLWLLKSKLPGKHDLYLVEGGSREVHYYCRFQLFYFDWLSASWPDFQITTPKDVTFHAVLHNGQN